MPGLSEGSYQVRGIFGNSRFAFWVRLQDYEALSRRQRLASPEGVSQGGYVIKDCCWVYLGHLQRASGSPGYKLRKGYELNLWFRSFRYLVCSRRFCLGLCMHYCLINRSGASIYTCRCLGFQMAHSVGQPCQLHLVLSHPRFSTNPFPKVTVKSFLESHSVSGAPLPLAETK